MTYRLNLTSPDTKIEKSNFYLFLAIPNFLEKEKKKMQVVRSGDLKKLFSRKSGCNSFRSHCIYVIRYNISYTVFRGVKIADGKRVGYFERYIALLYVTARRTTL